MTAALVLVLFGNSVFLAGIQAQLQASTAAEWIAVETETSADLILEHHPTAILFDLSAGHPDFVIPLLRDNPNVLLIGMMASSDEMLVLSGRHARAQSIEDLFAVIGRLPDVSVQDGRPLAR